MGTDTVIHVEGLSFTYPSRTRPTLRGIDLQIREGEFVLLTGPTGCGKSTLLKVLNGIIPWEASGEMVGRVRVAGLDTRTTPHARLCQQVGLVFQSPDDQLFATIIEDEVAFGLENLNLPTATIHQRVQEALEIVGLGGMERRPTAALSGGQKQRVAIAAVIAMRPRVLALDEPLSQLDPVGAAEVLAVLHELNHRHGITVLMVEHRVHEVAETVDRIVVLAEGEIVLDAPTHRAFADLSPYQRYGLRVPETVELFARLGQLARPLTAAEAIPLLRTAMPLRTCGKRTTQPMPTRNGHPPALEVQNVYYRYGRRDIWALAGANLEVGEGERIALMGTNGSGKSTLLLNSCAVLKPERGQVALLGRDLKRASPYALAGVAGVVFQNPDLMLFADSVGEEIAFGPRQLGYEDAEVRRRVSEALQAMTIEPLVADLPLSLSRGQRLRTAVAAVIALQPKIVLLDEPTTGQDRVHIEAMMDYLTTQKQRPTIIFCTHDMLVAARYADRIVAMSGGKIVGQGAPRTILADRALLQQTSLRAPQMLQLAEGLGLPPILDLEEMVEVLS